MFDHWSPPARTGRTCVQTNTLPHTHLPLQCPDGEIIQHEEIHTT